MSRAATLGLVLIAALALALRLPRLEERPLHTDESVHAVKFLGLWEGRGYRYDPDEYHGPSLYYATLPFAWLSGASPVYDAPASREPVGVGVAERLPSSADLPGGLISSSVSTPEDTPASDRLRFLAPAHRSGAGTALRERTLRLVPVAFGVGLILLLPLLRDVLGRGGVLGAGLFTAISPAFVYYSRYYIHELLLVFFTLLLLGGAWRYWKSGALGWGVVAGASLGLMHATKETFVFVLAALALATVATVLWERWVPSPAHPIGIGPPEATPALREWGRKARARLRWGHALVALAAVVVVSTALFTSLFTNPQGPLDSLRTYLPWFGRAGGNSPHIHPWSFYLERLGWFHFPRGPVWSEGLIILLALGGWGAALCGHKPADGCVRFLRFLGFYTFGLATIYCLIPYKTPWCLLGFHHGFILLAGAALPALGALLQRRPLARVLVLVGLGVATVQLGLQAWRTAFPYATDRRNPYVYAHTSKDLLRLVDTIQAITHYAPQGDAEVIKVMAPGRDYWPLPWYLRRFKNIGWYPEIPNDPYASLMVVNAQFEAELDEKSGKQWLMVGLFEHRPRVFVELYVAFDRWKKYLESRPKPPEDE